MDRFTSMAVFVRTVDLGSFTTAATASRISPQMVAKHVAFLEDRLGARLLNRTTRKQSLTELGRAYYKRCKLVLAEAQAADQLGQEVRTAPRGCLRVNAPVTFGTYSLVPLVTRYLPAHPDVQVDRTLSDCLVDSRVPWFRLLVGRTGPPLAVHTRRPPLRRRGGRTVGDQRRKGASARGHERVWHRARCRTRSARGHRGWPSRARPAGL